MTTVCGECGMPHRPGALFCTTCGRPAPLAAPPSRRLPAALIPVLAVIALAGAVGGIVHLLHSPASATTTPASAPAAPPSTSPPSPTTTAAMTTAATPGELLQAQASADQPTVKAVVGYWVPQLSSKQVGTVDAGVVYDDAAILRDVLAYKSTYPQAAVLRSEDYTSFSLGGFWVTIVATPFATAAQANAWCDAQSLGSNDCFAKRLSHTDGPQGNTVHR